jgi:hypothetical protein
VTPLRQKRTAELVRRNYSESTARVYLRNVQEFAKHFNRPPDQLGPEHISEYTAHRFQVRRLSSSAVNQQVAGRVDPAGSCMKLQPGVPGDRMIRTLQQVGYSIIRQRGSRVRLQHPGPCGVPTGSSVIGLDRRNV